MSVRMDGYMGTVMALEGMSDAETLLHGPYGCRLLLTCVSDALYPRPDDKVDMGTPYYGGLPRIPNTEVSTTDYIYGAYNKVRDALKYIKEQNNPRLISVINSPGASLIGDDCQRAAEEAGVADITMVLDAKLMSQPFNVGMDYAFTELLKKLAPEKRETVKDTVNILGVNIMMKDWQTVVWEFTEILEKMDLKVTCALGAGNSVQDVVDSATAELNVVICPEFAAGPVDYYRDVLGIPSVGLMYAPVGFSATAELIHKIADATGKDPSKALDYVRRIATRAYNSFVIDNRRLLGKSFVVDTNPSVAYPLVKTLYEDMSMVPKHISFAGLGDKMCEKLLKDFLDEHGLTGNLEDDYPDRYDFAFTDGNTAHMEEVTGHCKTGVNIGYPSEVGTDYRYSPVIGPLGMLYIIDRIVNLIPN